VALTDAQRKRNQRRAHRAKALNDRIQAAPANGPRTQDQLEAQRELAAERSAVAQEENVAVAWVGPDLVVSGDAKPLRRD